MVCWSVLVKGILSQCVNDRRVSRYGVKHKLSSFVIKSFLKTKWKLRNLETKHAGLEQYWNTLQHFIVLKSAFLKLNSNYNFFKWLKSNELQIVLHGKSTCQKNNLLVQLVTFFIQCRDDFNRYKPWATLNCYDTIVHYNLMNRWMLQDTNYLDPEI